MRRQTTQRESHSSLPTTIEALNNVCAQDGERGLGIHCGAVSPLEEPVRIPFRLVSFSPVATRAEATCIHPTHGTSLRLCHLCRRRVFRIHAEVGLQAPDDGVDAPPSISDFEARMAYSNQDVLAAMENFLASDVNEVISFFATFNTSTYPFHTRRSSSPSSPSHAHSRVSLSQGSHPSSDVSGFSSSWTTRSSTPRPFLSDAEAWSAKIEGQHFVTPLKTQRI